MEDDELEFNPCCCMGLRSGARAVGGFCTLVSGATLAAVVATVTGEDGWAGLRNMLGVDYDIGRGLGIAGTC